MLRRTVLKTYLATLALAVLGGFATATLRAADAAAEDWPHFLGPHSNNTSLETGLLDAWGKDGPPIVWSKTIGTGYGAPSVRGDRLVMHHRVGDEEIVDCLNPATGESLWRYPYPSKYQDPYGYNNGPRSAPLLTEDKCYTFGAEGKLLCLDLKTGKVIWQRDTGKEWDVPEAFFGVGSSPVLEGNKLIVMVGGQPNSGVVALDPATGKSIWECVGQKNWQGQPMYGWPGERTVAWRNYDKQASYSSPVVATINGKRTVFALMRQGLVCIDADSGQVNFSRWFRAIVNESVNAMNPVVVDDMVFFSGAYYKVGSVLVKVKPDNKSFDQIWAGTALEIHWNTPIYHEGYLYAFSGRNEPDARFRCVEFKTGKLMWDRDESWPLHSPETPKVYGRGSAIMADGKLIVLGEGGKLGMFKLNPQKPEEICAAQIAQLHHPCWAAPVLSHKRLFIRSEDRLLCFNLAK